MEQFVAIARVAIKFVVQPNDYSNTNSGNIKIMCWNAQSLQSKWLGTIDYIHLNNIDAAIFTETWLNTHNKNSNTDLNINKTNIFIPNFTIYVNVP